MVQKKNNGFDEFLVIKVTDLKDNPVPFGDKEKLIERAEGNWKTTLKTIGRTNRALVMYKKRILGEFILSDQIKIIRGEKPRIRFSFKKEVEDSKLKGLLLSKYITPNPITLLKEEDIEKYK